MQVTFQRKDETIGHVDGKLRREIFLKSIANTYNVIHRQKVRYTIVYSDSCVTSVDSQIHASIQALIQSNLTTHAQFCLLRTRKDFFIKKKKYIKKRQIQRESPDVSISVCDMKQKLHTNHCTQLYACGSYCSYLQRF